MKMRSISCAGVLHLADGFFVFLLGQLPDLVLVHAVMQKYWLMAVNSF
jgi:hypothetical protein